MIQAVVPARTLLDKAAGKSLIFFA